MISVIVPVYNTSLYLRKCIDSIVGQNYSDLQIILIDDGSTDDSGKICDEYAKNDSRIEVIHQTNKGLSETRNVGLKYAKGEYIGFVDSDDWIDTEMYSHLLNNLTENDADISVCECHMAYDDCKADNKPSEVECFTQEEYAKYFFKIGHQKIVHYVWNKLYKRDMFEENHADSQYKIGEDVIVFYKALLKAEKIVSSNQVLYYYRQASGMTRKFSEDYFKLIDVWESVNNLTLERAPHYSEYAKINMVRINMTLLTELAISGEYKNPLYKDRIKQYLNALKKGRKILLHSDIAKSRKLLVKLFCFNYKFSAFIIYKVKKIA